VHYRRIAIWCAVLLAGVMWRAAAPRFTGGLLDLIVFIPPGAALGLAAVWSAHAFAPEQYTWRRGLAGALVGGVVVSPLIAFLVAVAAAWDRASFQFVFNVGAWLAIAGGLCVGAVGWVAGWIEARRLQRKLKEARHVFQAIRDRRGGARRGRVHAGDHEDTGQRFPAGRLTAGRGMAGRL
jgi:hypothetical protein